jgi:DNA-binding Xre family transcriptional regulator
MSSNDNHDVDNHNDDSNPNNVVFRKWSQPTTPKQDPEVLKLEAEVTITRNELKKMQEKGRQVRLHHLQALDALETKRVTLAEILRRMDNELFNDTDVYKYGDVLAEVFGERVIFAHRAIGLEALLCQFMHQMLAKQHQLKIIKKAAKDIQNLYQKRKSHLKDEFYSFEAQAVQLEASRLTLEALYEDVFTSQHRLLARLMDVVAGKTTLNIPISPLAAKRGPPVRIMPSLKVSTKPTEQAVTPENVSTPIMDPGENDDIDEAMDILAVSGHSKLSDDFEDDEKKDYEVSLSNMSISLDDQSVRSVDDVSAMSVGSLSGGGSRRTIRDNMRITEQLKAMQSSSANSPMSSKKPNAVAVKQVREQASPIPEKTLPSAVSSSQKTARERRRQIEHMRLSGEVGNRSGASSKVNANMYDDDKTSVRVRMRELEDVANQKRASTSPKNESLASKKDGSDSTSSKDVKSAPKQESSKSSPSKEGSSGDSRTNDSTPSLEHR